MSRFCGGLIFLQLLVFFNWQANALILNVNESYCRGIQQYCTLCSEYEKSDYFACENGGVLHGGRCQCRTGFTGTYCESKITTPECNCRNGGQCYNSRCVCSREFTGMYCESRIQTPECKCKNGGQCYNGRCICTHGFTGSYCETRLTDLRYECKNGGVISTDGYCHCPTGYTGMYCETRIQTPECRCANGGRCHNDRCICMSGYTGRYCEYKTPECKCQNEGECYEDSCICRAGFTGMYCETKIPSYDCRCENGGQCYNGRCHCMTGYTGRHCESMIPTRSECNCINGGECYNGRCHCKTGYTGRHCESMIPSRLECNCQNGGECYRGGCVCGPEFTGTYCESRIPVIVGCATQQIYDEARKDYIHPPNCLPVCNKPEIQHPQYEVNSHYIISNGKHMLTKFELQCAHGYTLSGSSTLNCVSGNQWDRPVPQCHRNIDYVVNGDGLKPIEEPSPYYYGLSINCSDPGTPINGIRTVNASQYSNGRFIHEAIITFSCFPGYHLEGNRQIKCNYYGSWSSGLPRCVPATQVHTAVRCSRPPAIHNGRLSIINQDLRYSSNSRSHTQGYTSVDVVDQRTVRPGDIVRYSCNEGYEIVGSAETECLSNGHWRNQAPICRANCGTYPGYSMYSKVSTAPWHFSLYKNDYYEKKLICGATLINQYYLITAATCVTYEDTRGLLPYNTLNVHQGNFQEGSPSKEYQIKSIILNHNYDETNQDSDIALIQLDRPVLFNDHIHPICLPEVSDPREIMYFEIPDGTVGIVTGLGSPEGYVVPQQLKQFVMTTINRTFCQQQVEQTSLSSNMFCAVGQVPGGFGACYGDGGGSFAVSKDNDRRFELHGIVSMGRPNCEPRYTVFAKVVKFLTWIKQAISIV